MHKTPGRLSSVRAFGNFAAGVLLSFNRGLMREPNYNPTEAEIREACMEIQEGWTDEERLQRAGRSAPVWNVPKRRYAPALEWQTGRQPSPGE